MSRSRVAGLVTDTAGVASPTAPNHVSVAAVMTASDSCRGDGEVEFGRRIGLCFGEKDRD